MSKILLVEDDPTICETVVDLLESDKHIVEVVGNGNDAIQILEYNSFDLLILDWQLPGASGPAICKSVRGRKDTTPVLMLTSRAAITDKEQGFDAGADDYLAKPFDIRELRVRVKALLRRTKQEYSDNELTFRHLTLQLDTRTAYSDGKEIELLPKEFSLLELFLRNPNKVLTAEQIIGAVWKSDETGSQGALRQGLVRLRKKINKDGVTFIHSIYGVGYKFIE